MAGDPAHRSGPRALPADHSADRPWQVHGYDTFAREHYPIGRYATKEEAVAVATRKLQELQDHQDPELRDDVWVTGPDGQGWP